MTAPLRIATRGSALALWQANHVADLLRAARPGVEVELVRIATTGDSDREKPLSRLGGVGVFTREIQHAVLDGRADVAVHSLKDLPTLPVEGISLAAVPERASPHDALILPDSGPELSNWDQLPRGARIGTGSQRRRAQLWHARPDLDFLEVRGNVESRLRKLDEGQYDALVLAVAGLERLGLAGRISFRLAPPILFPAVGQGALGLECRPDDTAAQKLLELIDHRPTHQSAVAERRVLARLQAGCHAPVGIVSEPRGDRLRIEAVVLSADGKQKLRAESEGALDGAVAVGDSVADDLLRQGAGPLIAAAERADDSPLSAP